MALCTPGIRQMLFTLRLLQRNKMGIFHVNHSYRILIQFMASSYRLVLEMSRKTRLNLGLGAPALHLLVSMVKLASKWTAGK